MEVADKKSGVPDGWEVVETPSDVQPQQRSRTGQMYTPPTDSGPIGELGSHLVSGMNPLNIIASGAKLVGNMVTDPQAAGQQVIDTIAAPFRTAASGNLAGAAGDVLALAAMPKLYGAGSEMLANGTKAVLHPAVRGPATAALDVGAAALDNPIAGFISPRAAHLGRGMGAAADIIRPRPLIEPVSPGGPRRGPNDPPASVETAQQTLARRMQEHAAQLDDQATVKTIVQAASDVDKVVKAEKIKLTLAEYLEVSQQVSRGIEPAKALENVKLAGELARRLGTELYIKARSVKR